MEVSASSTGSEVQLMYRLTIKPEKRGPPKPSINPVDPNALHIIPEVGDAQAVSPYSRPVLRRQFELFWAGLFEDFIAINPQHPLRLSRQNLLSQLVLLTH